MSFRIVETTPITGTREGRPDYTSLGEVSRGNFRESLEKLAANERVVRWVITFSNTPGFYPWIAPPLAVGAVTHLIDDSTGLPTPYKVPAGYKIELIDVIWSFTDLVSAQLYMDRILGFMQLVAEYYPETLGPVSVRQLGGAGLATTLVDPSSSSSHELDVMGTNVGTTTVLGTGVSIWKLTDVGSPPRPKTKTVKCRVCGTLNEVLDESTLVTCSSCGKLTAVAHHPWGGT